METKDAVILGLLGTGIVATGFGVYYVLKNRNRAEELQKVLEEQAALLADVKAEVKAIGIELQNAQYPMSEEVANGIRSELANYEWKLVKAQELNQKAQDLGSQKDFMDEFTSAITDALIEVGIFLIKPIIGIAVAVGVAKGAMYFGPKLMKSIIEWIKNDRGGPPPPWTCSGCGAQFETEDELKNHIETEHPPTSDTSAIMQAQTQFQTLSSTTQLAVAAESGVYEKSGWSWLNLPDWDLQSLGWGSMSLENVGAETAVEVVILRSISTLLFAL